jgi:hypothetical protein
MPHEPLTKQVETQPVLVLGATGAQAFGITPLTFAEWATHNVERIAHRP